MSKQLDKAREAYKAGQYKKAVDTLWEVGLSQEYGVDEARELLDLASAIRNRTDGRLREECDEHIRRAQKAIDVLEDHSASSRLQLKETGLKKDPAALARWAREAGLGWLEIETAEDIVAACLQAAMAADAAGREEEPQPCVIDLVEAEGWKLEHVQYVFRPTTVQTSPLRGAELFMGGEVVEGRMQYLYLFRRLATDAA